jgi:hypothetical protein
MMTYQDGQINTSILVTKISHRKSESVKISGSNGSVHVNGRTVVLFDKEANEIESHTFHSKEHEVEQQLSFFIAKSIGNSEPIVKDQNLIDQLSNMRTIDAIYESHKGNKAIKLR